MSTLRVVDYEEVDRRMMSDDENASPAPKKGQSNFSKHAASDETLYWRSSASPESCEMSPYRAGSSQYLDQRASQSSFQSQSPSSSSFDLEGSRRTSSNSGAQPLSQSMTRESSPGYDARHNQSMEVTPARTHAAVDGKEARSPERSASY